MKRWPHAFQHVAGKFLSMLIMVASSTVSHMVLAFRAFFCGCGWLPLRREPFLVFLFCEDVDIWLLCVMLGHAGRMSQRAITCDSRRRRWY